MTPRSTPPNRRGSIDDLLAEMQRLAGGESRPKSTRKRRWWLLVVAVIAPFPVLLRIGMLAYQETTWPVLLCLTVAAIAAALALALPIIVLIRRRGGGVRLFIVRAAIVLSLAYLGYGLLYLSPSRFKRPEVAETYRTLHPLIRLSLSALVLIDGELIVTDAAREPEDYQAMGLPVFERSLHFEQADGWVHAFDMRTRGRSDTAVFLVRAYFDAVGLKTLRHVGTADHLHVYLGVPLERR